MYDIEMSQRLVGGVNLDVPFQGMFGCIETEHDVALLCLAMHKFNKTSVTLDELKVTKADYPDIGWVQDVDPECFDNFYITTEPLYALTPMAYQRLLKRIFD